MKLTLHLSLCLSILLLPLCVQSKHTAGAFSVNRKFLADPEKTDSASIGEKKDDQVNPPAPSVDDKTEEKKDDQVNPPAPSVDDKTEEKKDDQVNPPAPSVDDKTEEKKDDQVDPPAPSVDDKTEEKKDDQVDPPAHSVDDKTEEKKDDQVNPPAHSVDDKTEEKKDDQVNPPAPSVDDKTEEKKDDQVDPINTNTPAPVDDGKTPAPVDDGKTPAPVDDGKTPAPVDDGKTPAPVDDGNTPVPEKNTTDTSVIQPDGDKSYDLTFQQKLKFLMSPKKPWIYLISGLVGFILIAFIIFGFSRFFVDSEEQEEYSMSANVEKGRDNAKIQTLQLDFYKQTTEVQIVN